MSVETPTRPAAFQNLKETPLGVPVEPTGTYCAFHGKQAGSACDECDKEYPDAVSARAVAGPATVPTADVQALVDAAVKKAIAEQVAFQAWKQSPEGQAAAQAAPTAGQTAPDHGTPTP